MKIVVACIAFIASAGTVFAAGPAPVVTPGPFEPPPAYDTVYAPAKIYNWTGFYIGGNGGGAFGNTNWTSTPDAVGGSFNISGGVFGGTLGYNLQTGDALVVGAETDMDWFSGSGIVSPTVAPTACGTPGPGPCSFKIPWLATARLRFGYAFNWILPYVTGGVAIGELDATQSGAGFGTAISYNLGWTAGAGVEFAISEALRAKVEYLYVNLNGFSCYGPCGAQISGGPISFNPASNVIRGGLNYRFGN